MDAGPVQNAPLSARAGCTVCGQPARFTCSACGDTGPRFCSAECQGLNWDSHKVVCKGAQSVRQRSPQQHSPGTVVPEVVVEPNEEALAPPAAAPVGATGGRSRARRRRLQGRGNAAQAINSETHWIDRIRQYLPFQPRNATADPAVVIPERVDSAIIEEQELSEEEKIEDLKYYMEQIFLIIKPVIACMALSILWVKLTTESTPLYDSGIAVQTAPTTSVGANLGFSGSSSGSAFLSAAAILGEIIGATLIIVALFYFNCMKILYVLFMLIVTGLLGVFSWTLGNELLTVHNLAFDIITFWFFIWNLAVVGVTQIFYKGPMLLQQCYLVFMSSLMAHSLTKLPSLTTWILLALLAVWDLIAVLCPFGPLRILVETAQTHDREIPAMLYSAMVWMMASSGDPPSVRPPPANPSANITRRASAARSDTSSWHALQSDFGEGSHLIKGQPLVTEIEMTVREPTPAPAAPDSAILESDPLNAPTENPGATLDDREVAEEAAEEEEAARGGVKLGLGDFVFYSVLVGRAALFDWVTTFACSIAVLTGLNATIFLLAMYQKALPALPISIAFGILFYFVSAITLSPLMNFLVKRPERVVVAGAPAWLWVGQGGGGGMVYV
ncbi:Presenilin-1 [Geranomyces michiganensis]|nr:Presenilin-1 [Geranomyces michiganensis]